MFFIYFFHIQSADKQQIKNKHSKCFVVHLSTRQRQYLQTKHINATWCFSKIYDSFLELSFKFFFYTKILYTNFEFELDFLGLPTTFLFLNEQFYRKILKYIAHT